MKTMTADISTQFSKGNCKILNEPEIKKEVYVSAATMVMDAFKAFRTKSRDSDVLIYSVPSSNCVDACESYHKTLVKTTWKSFDEFIIHGFHQFHIVKFPIKNWKTDSKCTCPAFFKQHMCKHIVAIGVRSKIVELPANANPVRLAPTKKKPGRPKNAARALIVQ